VTNAGYGGQGGEMKVAGYASQYRSARAKALD